MGDVNNEKKEASSLAPIKPQDRIMSWGPTRCSGLADVFPSER